MLYPLTKYAKKCSGGWIDRCPAHDDKNPSLSIKETFDGVLLLKCFAGCSFEEIIEAASLKGDTLNGSQHAQNAYTRADAANDLSKRISMAKNIWQARKCRESKSGDIQNQKKKQVHQQVPSCLPIVVNLFVLHCFLICSVSG